VCGRFTLTLPPDLIAEAFGLDDVPMLEARYNIAPTQPVAVVRRLRSGGPRQLDLLRWGLRLPPTPGVRTGGPVINARSESVAKRSAFRDAFRRRRCLVPADGFYEWRTDENGRQALWISRADRGLFAFAGVWAASPGRNGAPVHSCAIVTCEPNGVMRPIHDRMPVILDPDAEAAWLFQSADPDELLDLLRPVPDDALAVREVTDSVNDVRNDGPGLLESPLRLF
jgi:putative SOS response-associated peptidase YedK